MSSFSGDGVNNNKNSEQFPEMLTMKDLAKPDGSDVDEPTPPAIHIEDLSSPFEKEEPDLDGTPEKMDASGALDSNNKSLDSSVHSSFPKERNLLKSHRITVKDTSEFPKGDNVETTERSGVPGKDTGAFSYGGRYLCDFSYSRDGNKPSHIEEIDEDLIIKRARAALKRADKVSPPKSRVLLYSSQHNAASFRSTNVSMNLSSMPWQPVGMSTPLVRAVAGVTVGEPDSNFVEMSELSFGDGGAVVVQVGESGVGSGMAVARTVKQLSPVMEDILRRKEILKASIEEGN